LRLTLTLIVIVFNVVGISLEETGRIGFVDRSNEVRRARADFLQFESGCRVKFPLATSNGMAEANEIQTKTHAFLTSINLSFTSFSTPLVSATSTSFLSPILEPFANL